MVAPRIAPQVAILAGSDADLPVMQDAAAVVEALGIEFQVEVVGADHSPRRAVEYAASAEARGIKVIIAGSGPAGHLPGVVAGFTSLPVIGVPIGASPDGGAASLLATAQMPEGVPVATVGIGAARNAGLLAAEILAVSDTALRRRVQDYKRALASRVAFDADELIAGSLLTRGTRSHDDRALFAPGDEGDLGAAEQV
jgi:5-(carboxyamino)imidazole ribonucleotide mutase